MRCGAVRCGVVSRTVAMLCYAMLCYVMFMFMGPSLLFFTYLYGGVYRYIERERKKERERERKKEMQHLPLLIYRFPGPRIAINRRRILRASLD
jgi:hypothetical protein